MNSVELSRRLENIIRIGTVAEIDYAARRVRVESGELLTGWLKWRAGRAGQTRTWDPPTIGEQVMILSPSGELANGIVLPSIYCDEFDAPSGNRDEHTVRYPDGAQVTYNHATGALHATGIRTATIEAADLITLDTPEVFVTGTVIADRVISHGVVLHSHTHVGVTPGNSNTGVPT